MKRDRSTKGDRYAPYSKFGRWLNRLKRGRFLPPPIHQGNSDDGGKREPLVRTSLSEIQNSEAESSTSQDSHHTSKSPSSDPATPMVAAIGGIPKPYIFAELDAETGEVFFIIASEGRPSTSVSEKASKEIGDGDHVTPYSAFLQIVYSAVEDADPKDIPGMIEQMSNIFLKKDAAPVDLTTGTDLCQDFEKKLSKMRVKRKIISQRIRRMELSKPAGDDGYKGTISLNVRKHGQVEESMNFIADNYHELCEPLKREEKLFIAKFVAARAQEFISNLNLEEDVSFSKGRVKAKRAAKESNLRQKIQSYKIDGLPVAAGNIEDKIRVVKSHITRKRDQDRTADEAVTLKDIAYHDRIRGEGTRVNMALKGLRALNELIMVKNKLEAIGEDGSLSEEDKLEQKKELVDGLRLNKDIESGGLRGTELNPTLGIEDINSIINRDGTGLNISNDQLKELSHKAGYLFARLFDYEMVEYESENIIKSRDDLRALYRLSTRHLSFMCCAFKHLTTLSSENRLEAVESFSSAVLEEQDWDRVIVEGSTTLDKDTLIDNIKSNADFDVSSLFPHMQRSPGKCVTM